MAETLAQAVLEVGVDDSRLPAGLQGVERQARQTANVVNSIFKAGGIVTGAIAAARSFGGLIDAAVELENITRKLSNTLGEAGAQKALGDLRSLSERLGISFTVLADSFGSFTAAASAAGISLAVQKDLFEAVSTSAQRLGLSNDAINGSLRALQQVAAKGTVQMEELRGQLGERLPTALAATAQGLGISSRELIKLVESGKLTANEFFPALTKGLTKLNGNVDGGVLTAEQNFAIFGDRLKDLQAEFGKDFLPGVIATVKQLTELLKEISIQKRSADIGGSFGIGGSLSDQVVGRQIDVERRLGLSREQSKRIVSDAIAEIDRSAGGTNRTRNAFGQRILTDAEQSRLLDLIGERAEVFSRPARLAAARREAENAEAAAEEARSAALLNTPGKIKERLSALRKESEGFDFSSSRFKENQAEIAQLEARLEAQTGKGAQKLADAGKKIREEIEKGAQKLEDALASLQKAQETEALAIVDQIDIASSQGIEKARQTLIDDIRFNISSGNIDLTKVASRFGVGIANLNSFEDSARPGVRQFSEAALNLQGVDLSKLAEISTATSKLADADLNTARASEQLSKANEELNKAIAENNRLLGIANQRESNLFVTVPVGGQRQVYLP